MTRKWLLAFLPVIVLAGCSTAEPKAQVGGAGPPSAKAAGMGNAGPDEEDLWWPEDEQQHVQSIADPFRPVNKAFFVFNNKLYFWLVKPVATGYGWVVPEFARIGVRNFFANLGFLNRTVNCALQGNFGGSGTELARFGINTTVGVLGFGDPALHWWGIREHNEDFGQTFAVWGMGPGPYLDVPLLGPSCGRELLGTVGDIALAPATYLPGVNILVRINYTSLHLGEYEDLLDAALDPYVGVRDAWYQHRLYLIDQRHVSRIPPPSGQAEGAAAD